MTPDEEAAKFGAALDVWLADVKEAALLLFRNGCPPDKCGDIAIAVVNAKAIAKMRRLQGVAPSGIFLPRGPLS